MRIVAIGLPTEISEIISTHDFDVTYAVDGIIGIREIVARIPDLAIVNIKMEHLGGLALARVLARLRVPVPIVFVSESEEALPTAQKLANFTDFIVIPRLASLTDASYYKEISKTGKALKAALGNKTQCPLSIEEWTSLMAPSGRKRILIVEDDPISRKLLTMLLDKPDEIEIYTAENGLDGLFKALLVSPDLILTDMSMPEVDGLTMSQIMYLLGKAYPIVFLTATSDENIVRKARNLKSVIGYLVKGDMGNKVVLMRAIQDYIKKAEESAEASKKAYKKASLETLLSSISEEGGLDF